MTKIEELKAAEAAADARDATRNAAWDAACDARDAVYDAAWDVYEA